MTAELHLVEMRKHMKLRLLDYIQQERRKSNTIEMKTIIAKFSFETGFKVSTLQVYIDELKMAGYVL